MLEPWMNHVAISADRTRVVLRYCKWCGGIVYSCPDPTCDGAYHHDVQPEDCPEDLIASQVQFVILDKNMADQYWTAREEHKN